MKTLIKRTLNISYGNEGPHYDPYGYTEYSLQLQYKGQEPVTIVLHGGGLMIWIEYCVGGCKPRRLDFNDDSASAESLFTSLTGLNCRQFEDVYYRLKQTCSTCGRITPVRMMEGFPGETFAICSICGKPVWCDFNESAVI